MKLTFKTANSRKTTFDKSSTHISTLDFGRWLPSQTLPVRRGDNVHVRLNQFVRLAPLAVPTYGNIKLLTRSYFVPFRLLSPRWFGFVQNNTPANDPTNRLPWCTNADLYSILLTNSEVTTGANDFLDSDNKGRVLNHNGRLLYQMFISLGYGINFTTADKTEFDLLPLLAVLRIMYDIEYPSRYVSQTAWNDIFNLDGYDHDSDWSIIVDMLTTLTSTFHESDFFVNSWESFNSPNSRNPIQYNSNNFSVSDPSQTSVSIQVTKDGNTVHSSNLTSTGLDTITSYGHKLLDALSDFALRNNIAGIRYLDFIRSHFGYTTSPEQDQFTKFLGSYVSNVNIMDVTSNVTNTETTMGEQAGKGYISGDGKLNYDVKEDGFIIFLTKLVPSYGYVQGRKPWTIRKPNFLSLYNPEFDGIGNEAVRNDALFADYKGGLQYSQGQNYGGRPDGVFGFAPRYTFGYKVGHDYLSGDFRLGSRNLGMSSFHTFRLLSNPSSTSPLSNNLAFRQISSQYDRMFSQSFSGSQVSYDHFVCYFEFDIKVASEMKSYSESLPFYEDEGREVTQTAQ